MASDELTALSAQWATPARNARGGINKVSKREAMGEQAMGATGRGGVEELPQAILTSTTVAPEATPIEPITADDVTGETPVVSTVEAPATTQDVSLAEDLRVGEPVVEDTLMKETQAEKERLAASTENALDDYITSVLTTPTYSELQQQAYTAEGVDALKAQVTNYESELRGEQHALRRKIEAIQSKGGGLAMGAQSEIANLERESLSKQADIAILSMAAQGKYSDAKAVADRAVDAMYERQEKINETLKFLYDENKDLFTVREQREFDLRQADRERNLEIQREETKLLKNTQLEAIAMANLNTAPQEVIDSIMSAETPQDILINGGQYVSTDLLYRQIKNQTLANAVRQGRLQDYELVQSQAATERRQAAIDAGELLPEQFEEVNGIDDDFRGEPIVKEFNEAAGKRYAFEQVIYSGEPLGTQDIFLVYEFMKALDPNSVVRESEFQTAAETGNIFDKTMSDWNGYFITGQTLPPEVRDSFVRTANASWSGKQDQYFNIKNEFGEKINRQFGVDNGATYLTSYEDAVPLDTADSPETAQIGEIIEKDGIRYIKEAGGFRQINDN